MFYINTLSFLLVLRYAFNLMGKNNLEKADKFYFMLDDNAKSFDFCGADGGPVEPVELIIRDGSGNLKLYVSGKMDGEVWKNIKSATGAKGVWSMEITPVQDFGFKMRNGASGWVATQSAALMKTK